MAEELCLTQEQLLVVQTQRDHLLSQLMEEKLGRCQDWERTLETQALPLNLTVERAAGLDATATTSSVKPAFTYELVLTEPPSHETVNDAPVRTP